MSATATQQKYPALADIVREETEGGRQIVRFYMRVADGTLDDFQDRHRMTAARRLDKIAPGLVDEYLRKYAGSTRRGRALSSTVKRAQAGGGDHTPRPISVFQRRLASVARNETGDGEAIVHFISDVMYGTITGFKPYHRLEAATELAGYILHDESYTPTPTPWFPNKTAVPAEAGTHPHNEAVSAESEPVHAEPVEAPTSDEPDATSTETDSETAVPTTEIVVPAKAGTHPKPVTTETDNETVVPAEAGTHPHPTSTETDNETVVPAKSLPPAKAGAGTHPQTVSDDPNNEIVVPAEAGTHPHNEAVSTDPESVSTDTDTVSTDTVHAEPVEAPTNPESPQLPTNNQKLTTNNPPHLAPELARYIARAENGADLRMRHWQQAYDALVERSQNEDVTELYQWLTGQIPGPDNRFIWGDDAIPPEVIFRPEIDYASMDPADLIDPKTGYTPMLDHLHPSTPWMLRCSQDCDVPQHNHAPRRTEPIIDARRIEQRLRDRQYEPDPPSYPGLAFNPRGRSPPA